jgi:hypothetical protein
MAKAVTIVAAGGVGVTNLDVLSGFGAAMTPVSSGGQAVTLVPSGGQPVVLINEDGSLFSNLGGVTPYHYWDFINDRALFASADVGPVASTPGWSFSRASTGYYTNADGTLTSFASGALRRGNRGVLIEGARTNLLLRSQEFDNASWAKSNSTATANAIVAPDGTTTADRLIENTNNNVHNFGQAVVTTAAAHTFSVYAKAGERTYMLMYHNVSGQGRVFDLASGALGGVAGLGTPTTSTITALGNGWYRCSITVTATAASNEFYCYAMSDATTYFYAGSTSNGLYLWGAQLEAASFPSSYIPTTSASATRAADVLTVSSPGVDFPLTLFAEFERVVDTGTVESLLAVHAGVNERAQLYVDASDRATLLVLRGGGTEANPAVTGAIALATTARAAARVGTNSGQVARGGTLASEDTSLTVPATPTAINIGSDPGSAFQGFGYLRRAAIINSAVNDAGLQAMTT